MSPKVEKFSEEAVERAHRDLYERIAVERPDGTRRPLFEVVDPDAESRAALAGKGVKGRAAGFSFERWRKVLNAERAGLGLTPVPRDWIEPALEEQSAAGFDEAESAKPSREVAVALGRLEVDPGEGPHGREYMTHYEAVSGWQSVHLVWNSDGFYEPWATGMGPYETEAEARAEAKSWAENEGLQYVDPVKAAVEAASDGALTLTEGTRINLTGFSDAPHLSNVRLPESTTEPKDNS
jgi:hypothetical protein